MDVLFCILLYQTWKNDSDGDFFLMLTFLTSVSLLTIYWIDQLVFLIFCFCILMLLVRLSHTDFAIIGFEFQPDVFVEILNQRQLKKKWDALKLKSVNLLLEKRALQFFQNTKNLQISKTSWTSKRIH